MATNSKIEWTDTTWNPTSGCTHASAGCDNCYAVTMTHRLENMGQAKYAGLTVLNPKGDRHFNGVVKCHDDALDIPLRWRKPRRVFVNSMSDLFHRDVPFEFVAKVYAVALLASHHTMQILTKRPERAVEFYEWLQKKSLGEPFGFLVDMGRQFIDRELAMRVVTRKDRPASRWPLPNVWLGASVENQAAADERIPHLLRCPAAVRFLSVEPMIGSVNLRPHIGPHCGCNPVSEPTPCDEYHETGRCSHTPSLIRWVIVGGESGHNARPCDIAWIREVISQCRDAGVPCFVKQLGAKPYEVDEAKKVARGHVAIDVHAVSFGGWKYEPYYFGRHPKGGDMTEWPEDLRVREFPK